MAAKNVNFAAADQLMLGCKIYDITKWTCAKKKSVKIYDFTGGSILKQIEVTIDIT